MSIRVSRYSHTTGEYRQWGIGQVEYSRPRWASPFSLQEGLGAALQRFRSHSITMVAKN